MPAQGKVYLFPVPLSDGDLRLCVASDITGPDESVKVMPLSEWARAKYDYAKTPTIFLLGQ